MLIATHLTANYINEDLVGGEGGGGTFARLKQFEGSRDETCD